MNGAAILRGVIRLGPSVFLCLGRLTCVAAVIVAAASSGELAAQQASDAYGYDYAARRFSGLYENADRETSNNTGDTTQLQMEWSEGFDLRDPARSQLGAWVTNYQRGTYTAADGKTYGWSYAVKLVYTGPGSAVFGYFTPQRESYAGGAGRNSTPQYRPPVLPQAQP
jgi:hypothetical protein